MLKVRLLEEMGAEPHTAPFYVEATGPGMPEMNEKVRVLNPVACMRSRFSNLIALRRDAERGSTPEPPKFPLSQF